MPSLRDARRCPARRASTAKCRSSGSPRSASRSGPAAPSSPARASAGPEVTSSVRSATSGIGAASELTGVATLILSSPGKAAMCWPGSSPDPCQPRGGHAYRRRQRAVWPWPGSGFDDATLLRYHIEYREARPSATRKPPRRRRMAAGGSYRRSAVPSWSSARSLRERVVGGGQKQDV
jgi:hypothetical protein